MLYHLGVGLICGILAVMAFIYENRNLINIGISQYRSKSKHE